MLCDSSGTGVSHVATTCQHYLYQCISNRSLQSQEGSKDQNDYLLPYFLPFSDAWPVGFSNMGESAPFAVVVALPMHWKNGLKQWLQY